MKRGLWEVLSSSAGSPASGAVLGVLGFITAIVSALSDERAAAIATAALLAAVVGILIRAQRVEAAFDGPYRVLESDVTWDLRDPDASETHVKRIQKVRFYFRTSVLAIRTKNDTGNDPFAELKVAQQGVKLGPTMKRDEWSHAVIWLHNEAVPSKETTVLTHELIERDCFPEKHDEWIELGGTQRGPASLTVLFPPSRPPLNVRLKHTCNGEDREGSVPHEQLRDEGGRIVYRLSRRKLKPGEVYRLKWDWEKRLEA